MSFPDPTLSVPDLDDYQLCLGSLVMGPGTPYELVELDGIDLPAVRTGDVDRPRDQGQFAGVNLLGGRDVTAKLEVAAMGDVTLQQALQVLGGATVPAATIETPLWIQIPGESLLATMVRVLKRPYAVNRAYWAGLAQVAMLAHATDPRLYGAPTKTATVTLPDSNGGVGFPIGFDVGFGGGSAAAVFDVYNNGNVEMRPIFVVTGPCSNPVISNETTSQSIGFDLTLAAGDTLTVDTDTAHTVTYLTAGTTAAAARQNAVAPGSTWPNLPPGANTFAFSAAAGVGVATLEVIWADAYLL